MQQIHTEQFFDACRGGVIEDARKMISNNGIDVNSQDSEGNTGLILAVEARKPDIVKYLIDQQADLNLQNLKGKTALHFACDKADKEIVLQLLLAGADYEIMDEDKKKPGAENIEIKKFLGDIIPEKEAFDVLKKEDRAKLIDIFNDIDLCEVPTKSINEEKSKRFNQFIDDTGATQSIIQKDAKDFIKWAAICNRETVNLDEWLFAFSKLYGSDQGVFYKFIQDYNEQSTKKGKLREQNFEDQI
ncbi:Ankyrin repeat-containing domain [Pseudocohnilembus persalinus]|uniref:Ankyrin repeat-containing domain n=1 Tax=Pseudocohnilembus persalinus TaxID=266149 RepID=A0A0V0QH32_PSEPJ|nr:Ankyrin repeat-containing domain [Pseudocohnilembus persalinus]|eukprot:KRX01603.1 Ankyrin repeat-containing domain [Pseudocohnilembus persalinus]